MLPIPFQQRAGAFVAGVAAAGAAYAGAQVCVQGVREERWRSRQKRKKKPSLLPPPTSSLPLSLFTPTAHALGVHPGPVVPPAQPAAPAHGCCLGESGDEGAEARARAHPNLSTAPLSLTAPLSFSSSLQAAPATADDPLFGRGARADARRTWNAGVDAVFQPVILALARRGW